MSLPECQEVQRRLLECQEGLLSLEGTARVRAHLARCPTCRRLWSQWEAQHQLLAEALQPVSAPPGLTPQVMAKVRASQARRRPAWQGPVVRLAVTAAAVVALALGVVVFRGPRYVQVGYLGVLAGRPTVVQRGAEHPSVVEDGSAVCDGALLVTGRGERLEVRLDDGSRLTLGGETKIRLSGRRIEADCGHYLPHVCLRRGELLCELLSPIHFRGVGTPLGSALGTGARFRIRHVPGDHTRLDVLSGAVRFSCPGREVRAAAGTRWVADAAGDVRRVKGKAAGD